MVAVLLKADGAFQASEMLTHQPDDRFNKTRFEVSA